MTDDSSLAYLKKDESVGSGIHELELSGHVPSKFNIPAKIGLFLALLTGLYMSSLYSYLLFHGIAEIFSISVGVCIFSITWNSKRFFENGYFLLIGIAYFFAAILDGVHTLAYRGMGVFSGYDANLPTQLWICARYLQSISLLVAPFFLGFKPKAYTILIVYSVIVVSILISIFTLDVFPNCYIEGIGLTRFKIISEYVICFILTVALFLLYRQRSKFEPRVFNLLVFSIAVTILSELSFTSYVSVYGFFNLLGHFLKILAFYLVYKAVVETGLKNPYSLMFRELDQEREHLRREIQVREKLQKELEINSEKYHIVADFAHDWEYWIAPEGTLLYISPSCERVTGYTVEEFMTNSRIILDIVLPEDQACVQKHFEINHDDMKLQKECSLDFRIAHKKMGVRCINHVCQAVYGKNGDYLGRRASNRDITDRKLAEESKTQLIAELEKAVTEIKTLRGLIPICSSCKKIRDDQGFWQAVDVYIRDRTEVQFSHSICPECAKKLYPELYSVD